MAKKFSPFLFLINGILWSALYITAGYKFIDHKWGFNVISPWDWGKLFTNFTQGKWAVNSMEILFFFTAIILFYPIWVWGWYLIRYWNVFGVFGIFKKLFNRKPKPTTKSDEPLSYKKFAPQKLRVQQSGAGYTMNVKQPQPTPTTEKPAETTPQPPRIKPEIAQIAAYADLFNAEHFSNVKLDGQTLDLTLATDEVAILIIVLNRPTVNWFFDSEQDTDSAEWFSEGGRIPSPIFALEKIRGALSASNPESRLIPLIVLTAGGLLDPDESKTILDGRGIQCVQFNNAEHPEMTSLQSVVEAVFDRKDGRISVAENNQVEETSEDVNDNSTDDVTDEGDTSNE